MNPIAGISLEALIQRATDSRNKNIDNTAIEACCAIIKDIPQSAFFASKQIAFRLQSDDEWEAMQGLSLLDHCMRKCGPCFQTEVAKFRFLNELIKLVSPKFLGAKTSPKVRDKVLGLIHSWTVAFPHEPKIKEAFDMLKKQGVVTDNIAKDLAQCRSEPKQTPTKSSNMVVDQEFEKKLQKLLSSKNAQDLDAANRMIKHKVYETERRINDLERVRTNVRLLAEMLDCYQTSEISQEDLQLMGELRSECERLKPTLFSLAADAQDAMLSDVLGVGEELTQVVERYEAVLARQNQPGSSSGNSSIQAPSSLLDLSPDHGKQALPDAEPLKPSTELFQQPLAILELTQPLPPISDLTTVPEPPKPVNTNMDHLGDLFGVMPSPSPRISSTIPGPGVSSRQPSAPAEKTSKQKALEELDVLGEIMLQKCKMDLEPIIATASGDAKLLDDAISDAMESVSLDDVMLCADETIAIAESPATSADIDAVPLESAGLCVDTPPATPTVKSLADVSVSIESIKPSGVPPMKLIESSSSVTVVLHLAKDTPRPDVSVYVVTTTSTSTLPISDYHLQVKVPKGCKFKLQTPSTTSLPPHNPFLPPSAITQILLIANPNRLKMDLTCMISFTMDDETLTEVGEVTGLAPC